MPQLWIVAGPNGAGKSTLVSRRLTTRIPVVNPDVIAQELPRIEGRLDERQAGMLAIRQRDALLAAGDDFAIETTLAGHNPLRFLIAAKQAGYKVTLVFVGVRSANTSALRVEKRVGEGGHAVPVDALQRRYPDSLAKLAQAIVIADRTYVFDNSDRRRRLVLIRERGRTRFRAPDPPAWIVRTLPDLF